MNPLNYSLRGQVKALLAGVIAALTYLVALDLPGLDGVILDDALEAALAFLVAYAAVFSAPNADR